MKILLEKVDQSPEANLRPNNAMKNGEMERGFENGKRIGKSS